MLSEHLHDQAAAPLSISPLAKAGFVPTWLGTSNPSLAAEALGQ